MSAVKPLDGLDLNQKRFVDQKVDSESGIEMETFEIDRYGSLPFDHMTALRKLRSKNGFIDAFQ